MCKCLQTSGLRRRGCFHSKSEALTPLTLVAHRLKEAQRFKVSGFGQPRNPSEYTAEELAEVRSTVKLAASFSGLVLVACDRDERIVQLVIVVVLQKCRRPIPQKKFVLLATAALSSCGPRDDSRTRNLDLRFVGAGTDQDVVTHDIVFRVENRYSDSRAEYLLSTTCRKPPVDHEDYRDQSGHGEESESHGDRHEAANVPR